MKDHKTREDYAEAYEQFQYVSFFKDYAVKGKKDEINKIIDKGKLVKFEKDHCIIEIDVKSEYFYIVMNGQVGFYIPKPKKGKEEQKQPRKFFSKEEKMKDSLHLVKVFKRGDSFGEISLLYNRGSDGSMYCHDNCYCLVLNKKDFLSIIGDEERDCVTKEVEFLQNHPLFEHWSFNLLRLLYFFSARIVYNKDEFVFKEGSKSNYVYIVKQGEFGIYKNIDTPKNIGNKMPGESESEEEENDDQISKQQTVTNDLLRSKTDKFKRYKVGVIGKGEIFGEEDILMKRQRSFSVMCESYSGKAQLIVIKRQVFSLSIMSDIGSSIQIKKRLKQKNENHIKRLDSIKVFIKDFKDFCFEDREGIEKKLSLQKGLNTEGTRSSQVNSNNKLQDGQSAPFLAITKEDNELKQKLFSTAPKIENKFDQQDRDRIARNNQPSPPKVIVAPSQIGNSERKLFKTKSQQSIDLSNQSSSSIAIKNNLVQKSSRSKSQEGKEIEYLKARSQSHQSTDSIGNQIYGLNQNSNQSKTLLNPNLPKPPKSRQLGSARNSHHELNKEQQILSNQEEIKNEFSSNKRKIQSAVSYSSGMFGEQLNALSHKIDEPSQPFFYPSTANSARQFSQITPNPVSTPPIILSEKEKRNSYQSPSSNSQAFNSSKSPNKMSSMHILEGSASIQEEEYQLNMEKKLNLQNVILEKSDSARHQKIQLKFFHQHCSNRSLTNRDPLLIKNFHQDGESINCEAKPKSYFSHHLVKTASMGSLCSMNQHEGSQSTSYLNDEKSKNEIEQKKAESEKDKKVKRFRNSIFTDQFQKTFQSNLRQIKSMVQKNTTQAKDIQQSIINHIKDTTIKNFLEQNYLLKNQEKINKQQAQKKEVPQKSSIHRILKTVFNLNCNESVQAQSSPYKQYIDNAIPLTNHKIKQVHAISQHSDSQSPRKEFQAELASQKSIETDRSKLLNASQPKQQSKTQVEQNKKVYKFQIQQQDSNPKQVNNFNRNINAIIKSKSEQLAMQIKSLQTQQQTPLQNDLDFNFTSSINDLDQVEIINQSNNIPVVSKEPSPQKLPSQPQSLYKIKSMPMRIYKTSNSKRGSQFKDANN